MLDKPIKVMNHGHVRWQPDVRDPLTGKRIRKFFKTLAKAREFQKKHGRAEAIDLQPEDDPQTPFRDYAAKLKSQKSFRKKSAASWDWALGHACDFIVNDLGTRFGDVPVAGIKRAFVKALLVQ